VTTRNLDALFAPRAIALVGASNQPGSVGAVVARNLFASGFEGPIRPVNPHEDRIQGVRNFRSIAELPETPDLAVVAAPPSVVPDAIAELAGRGCRAAVVITAGLDESERAKLLAAARPRLMRIVGPNCLGFLSPARGINASFAHLAPEAGDIAFLTQSGAIATSILDWAKGRGIGFSHVVSLGDMSDVDFGDLLDHLAFDAATAAILLYAENVTQPRKFMSAARIAARAKPVIVVKSGRSAAGARAAASHTGALAGADAVYDAAFRRAGMLRVDTLRDLFDAAATLASGVRPRSEALVIVTNGGGLGVIAADALERRGGALARLSEPTLAALDAALPGAWSHGNPIDILGDAHGERYEAALDALRDEPELGAALVMNCPTGVADNLEAARATLRARARQPELPLLACWMGEATAEAPRRLLSEAGLPSYETPDEAVRAFLQLVDYARNQAALLQAPTASARRTPAGRAAARAQIDQALSEGRAILTEPEAKAVLAAYGVPVVETVVAVTPAEAGAAAARLSGAVALKILSREISHKSDVGGVRLDLSGAAAVEAAATAMLENVLRTAPQARVDGFSVQPMIKRPLAQELLLGAVVDATFGPCLLFGQGGVATEIVADRAIGLPPLDSVLARDMISRTRVSKLLAGYRGRPPADHEAIVAALLSLSDLVVDFPEIVELDINPLLADAGGAIALDARIVIEPTPAGAVRLAIRPYPEKLVRTVESGGARFVLRPVRPDDAGALVRMAARTDPEHLRQRFHAATRDLSERTAARLALIDYDREMALVVEEPDGAIAGVVRLVFDPNYESGEYAIIVRTDLQDRGLGRLLMGEVLAYARSRGARRAWGDVSSDNPRMLAFARELGAALSARPDAPGVIRAEFALAD
jgi:acetyltransferase